MSWLPVVDSDLTWLLHHNMCVFYWSYNSEEVDIHGMDYYELYDVRQVNCKVVSFMSKRLQVNMI